MNQKARITFLLLVCGITGLTMWILGRHATPQQAPTLRPLLDRATEAKSAVDRVGQEAAKLSTEEEITLGRELTQQVRAQGLPEGLNKEREAQQIYLNALLALLVSKGQPRRTDLPFSVQLIEQPSINAFALPGGQIFMTTGMFDFAENEAELAAVLGHEMAHIDLRHCIEHYQYAARAGRVGGTPGRAVASLGTQLMLQGYQDEQEAEADRWGMQLATRAGYHPQGGQCLFSRLRRAWGGDAPPQSLPGEAAHAMSDAMEDLFATHPRPALRISNLTRAMAETGASPGSGRDYIGNRNKRTLVSLASLDVPEEHNRNWLVMDGPVP